MNGVTYYIEPVASGDGTRRERERAAVRRIIARVFGPDARLGHRADGAPYLEGVEISVSHSTTHAAVAVGPAGRRIGIDIESIGRPQLRHVASRILSGKELAEYGSGERRLAEAWTLKEALVKASGHLSADFRSDIRLPLPADGQKKAAVVRRHPDGTAADCVGFDILFSGEPAGCSGQWLSIVAESYSLMP